MTPESGHVVNPYAGSPGGSSPGPGIDEKEGNEDLRSFAILALASTAIMAVVGITAWLIAHHG
jgi:hypothetical protein